MGAGRAPRPAPPAAGTNKEANGGKDKGKKSGKDKDDDTREASQSQGSFGLSGGFVARGDGTGCAGDRLTVLSLEIHVQVGSDRRPDPRRDSVHAVCWRVKDAFTSAEREVVEVKTGAIVLPPAETAANVGVRATIGSSRTGPGSGPTSSSGGGELPGVAAVSRTSQFCLKCGKGKDSADGVPGAFCTFEGGGFLGQRLGRMGEVESAAAEAVGAREGEGRRTFRNGLGKGVKVVEVCSEAQLFRALVGVFCLHDPDFVVGWEVQGDSLGYVIERGLNMVRVV